MRIILICVAIFCKLGREIKRILRAMCTIFELFDPAMTSCK